jgi:hypothetical protein
MSRYWDLLKIQPDDNFIITVKTDNTGVSATNEVLLPIKGVDMLIDWGDGNVETVSQINLPNNTIGGNNVMHTYASSGTYTVKINDGLSRIYYNNGGDRLKLLSIEKFGSIVWQSDMNGAWWGCSNLVINASDVGDFSNVTNFDRAWQNCSSLTFFPLIDTSSGIFFGSSNFTGTWSGCSSLTSFPLIDTSNGTRFNSAWRNCSSLTSFPAIDTSSATGVHAFAYTWENCYSLTSFPLIDTSNGTFFLNTWRSCSSLTSFPLLDTSSGTSFADAWFGCISLTSFPLINTSSGTTFQNAWNGCSSLTSFPLLDTSSGTNFTSAWQSCSGLTTFPANAFDTNIATNYTSAFTTTALLTQSIDDILVSLDTSGVSNGTFAQLGGQAPSATGEAAIDSLVGKGWTVTVTGGYTP